MKPVLFLVLSTVCAALVSSASAQTYRSHAPLRPLPQPVKAPLATGPKRFVDATRGNDAGTGTEGAPWKSLAHATRQLQPGDTLYLRGGTYYEKVALTRSGTTNAPVTIASYPGELAVIDGGLREFHDSPATSWEPISSGAPGEFVSAKTYLHADDRKVPTQFLPASWEPMWGIEEERPLALGCFADSLLPLHGYRILEDLRASNELWAGGKKEMRESPVYGGPGLWFNRATGRIHIRLAPTQLAGLGDRAYRGETDPRKLPLVIAAGFGDDVLRVNGVKHVRLHGFVLRGATGSPMIHIYGSQNVELDHVTVFGGFPGLLVNASQNIRVAHSAFRGNASPWIGRAHMKYRGTASYQIVLKNEQPGNEHIEFAYCEFTDDHDFAFLRYVKNLQFHHNFVDNFNDDGLECGPKLRNHTLYIHENRIGACLGVFQQHEIEKDESPLDHDAKAGVFIYRNVFDFRAGVYYGVPSQPDPTGEFLHREGHLASDHGGPIWPVMHVYHNTFLRHTPTFRDYFLFGLGGQGLKNSERDVFNNLFVQSEKVPGTGFAGIKEPGNVREGGNLLWGVKDGPALKGDPFAKFRASPQFAGSKKFYEAGLTTHDRVADPLFVSYSTNLTSPADLRLQPGSAAINAGQPVPAEWPDPLRAADKDAPDSGALPLGAQPWGVGVEGRIPLFGEIRK